MEHIFGMAHKVYFVSSTLGQIFGARTIVYKDPNARANIRPDEVWLCLVKRVKGTMYAMPYKRFVEPLTFDFTLWKCGNAYTIPGYKILPNTFSLETRDTALKVLAKVGPLDQENFAFEPQEHTVQVYEWYDILVGRVDDEHKHLITPDIYFKALQHVNQDRRWACEKVMSLIKTRRARLHKIGKHRCAIFLQKEAPFCIDLHKGSFEYYEHDPSQWLSLS